MVSNIATNSCKHDEQSKKRGIRALPLETTNNLIISVDLCIDKLLPIPNTYTIVDSDVFCDIPNLQVDWILPCADESTPFERLTHLPSTIITSLMNFIDILYNYKSILSLTGEAAFFNSRYNRLDPSTSTHKSILVQDNHLKSQVFHYDSYRDGCTNSTQEVYISSSGKELESLILLVVLDLLEK